MNSLAIDLVGAVCLLLWGLRMVRTGVERAFGRQLHRWIAAGTRNRALAFGVGLVATLALQSSTATALMTASFAGRALMDTAMAQAIMLGANVGTSMVTQLVMLGGHWLSPALITLGFGMFSFGRSDRFRAIGRALLGLGLMLLSLHLLGQGTTPMRDSPVLIALLRTLAEVPLLAVLLAALLAVLASSSLAIVLLVASLGLAGGLDPGLTIALVLGANLGGAVPPVLATSTEGPLARRVTLGNLVVRAAGCVAVLPFTEESGWLLAYIGVQPMEMAVDAHILFNLALAVVFLPLVDHIALGAHHLLPQPERTADGPRYLDTSKLDTPSVALACAARETLRIGNRAAAMLICSLEAIRSDDTQRCAMISGMDDEIDRLNEAVKLYIAQLDRSTLSEDEERRSNEIMSYAINLEHVGDIVDKSLRELTEKKIRRQWSFSSDGFAEIEAFYDRTVDNLQLAQTVFLSRDPSLARRLVELKVDIRYMEQRSADRHVERLRQGRVESVETSALHLDILRDLKRINAHVASVAYPILEKSGDLMDSRLVRAPLQESTNPV